MVHCSNPSAALFVPMIPFVAKRLAGYILLEQGCYMRAAIQAAAVVHKRCSPDFQSDIVDKVQIVAAVSRRCSLLYLPQFVLFEKAQIEIVESRA